MFYLISVDHTVSNTVDLPMSQELVVWVVLTHYFRSFCITKLFLNRNLQTVDVDGSDGLLHVVTQVVEEIIVHKIEEIHLIVNMDVVISDHNIITIRQLVSLILLERTIVTQASKEVASSVKTILLITKQEGSLEIVRIGLIVHLNLNLDLVSTSVGSVIQPRILILYISSNKVVENLRIVCRLIKGTVKR
jgi:hypothetical protein